MYDNSRPQGQSVMGGINKGFQLNSLEVTDKGYKLEFKRDGFTSKYFGFLPYLEEGKQDQWQMKNEIWGGEILSLFLAFVPEEIVDEKKRDISARITAKLGEKMYETREGVLSAAQFFIKELFAASLPYLKDTTFNIVFAYTLGVDKETLADKYFLNIPNKYYWKEGDQYINTFPFACGDKLPLIKPDLILVDPLTEAKPATSEAPTTKPAALPPAPPEVPKTPEPPAEASAPAPLPAPPDDW